MTSRAPVGRRMISAIFTCMSSERPSSSSVGAFFDLSRRRITTASPSTVGSVATRMSSIRPAAAAFSEMRPSCGLRRSAMSSFASTFRRVVTPARHPLGDPLHLVEHAVDAEPHDERVLLRLEVDVAGPVLGRLEDDRVDEPDERGVGDAVVDLEIVDLLLGSPRRARPPRRALPVRRRPRRRAARRRISASMSSARRRRARAGNASRAAARRSRARCRVGDRDAQDVALDRVWDRAITRSSTWSGTAPWPPRRRRPAPEGRRAGRW